MTRWPSIANCLTRLMPTDPVPPVTRTVMSPCSGPGCTLETVVPAEKILVGEKLVECFERASACSKPAVHHGGDQRVYGGHRRRVRVEERLACKRANERDVCDLGRRGSERLRNHDRTSAPPIGELERVDRPLRVALE